MRIFFRTDAALQIGTGHVIRCLTLADALRDREAQCCFICREHPGNLIDLIHQRGYDVHALPYDENWKVQGERSAQAAWLGADWQIDVEQTKVDADDTSIDWLIVDHYALDRRWESSMRSHCRRLMVIDDLADRPHDCDLLLDQNLGRSQPDYASLLSPDTTTLLGPQYALLRPEFAALRAKSLARRATNPQLKHLLITMGGVDAGNATGQVLDTLKVFALPHDLRITVVLGPHAPWLADVEALAAKMPRPTQVLVGVSNMAELMADSDLAIGAAGGTAWERCCLGLPSFVLVLAENQLAGAIALQNEGAAISFGTCGQLAEYLGPSYSEQFAQKALKKMSNTASTLTDGKGCARVVDHMMERTHA